MSEFKQLAGYVYIRERLCILQNLLDLVEAFVLLPEVIRVFVLSEVRGFHRIALEGFQANVLDLLFNHLALDLLLASSPKHPVDDRFHDPPHKEEFVAGQKSDESSPLQNRLGGGDRSMVIRVEHVDKSGVHEGSDPCEGPETLEPWADRVRSDGDGPTEVFSDLECVGAEFDIVVDQRHDFGEYNVSQQTRGYLECDAPGAKGQMVDQMVT